VKTDHQVIIGDARDMQAVDSESIDFVVTSPPYPMIQMWDDSFCALNPDIKDHLDSNDGQTAYKLMHQELDRAWNEVHRVLKTGGFACINIGDATRKLGESFQLYPNHARILHHLMDLGFQVLPDILWRKQTNAPTKFMGSGMLPAGAYVTLEHEYILIARKGSKRVFKHDPEKALRRRSALFWEERNLFFSDIWMDLKGTRQNLNPNSARKRSGAFPFELAYRLICMYSVQQDTVLDPFAGTGTTQVAAAALCRNSMGVEKEPSLLPVIRQTFQHVAGIANQCNTDRLDRHREFVQHHEKSKKPLKHWNHHYDFGVMTAQETGLLFYNLSRCVELEDRNFEVHYETDLAKGGHSRPNKVTVPHDKQRQLPLS